MATWPNHELSRFVEAGGVRWHVQQSGTGPGLLLVHGTAASTHSWRDLIPILARRYTVLALDLPGHGFTAPVPASQSSIAGLSNLLTVLLGELKFEPAFVAGHSAGAVILCNMALSRQIDPRVVISVNGAFLPRLLARRAAHRDNVARVLESTGSHLSEEGIDFYARLVRQPTHITGALRMMSQWNLESFLTQLPLLRQPLALLVASNDKAVPLQQAFEVMQHVAHTTLYPLPELGHLAHEEQPALVAERILQICGAYDAHG